MPFHSTVHRHHVKPTGLDHRPGVKTSNFLTTGENEIAWDTANAGWAVSLTAKVVAPSTGLEPRRDSLT